MKTYRIQKIIWAIFQWLSPNGPKTLSEALVWKGGGGPMTQPDQYVAAVLFAALFCPQTLAGAVVDGAKTRAPS